MFARYDCPKCDYEGYTPCPDHSEINPRIKYHRMLDEAMDETEEGKFFLPVFVEKILAELAEKK